MGRKSKWPWVQENLILVEKWARDGADEIQIARNLGVGKTAFYEYKKKYAELAAALKNGKQPLIARLENNLLRRADGYEYEEVKTYIKQEGDKEVKFKEINKKHMPPDVAANHILLKNKDPEHHTNDRAALDLKRMEMELRKGLEEKKNW